VLPTPIAITGVRNAVQPISNDEYDLETEADAGFVGLKFLRGTVFALAAEVAAAASIYGLWRLWHVFR
jgi:hypothetical protein